MREEILKRNLKLEIMESLDDEYGIISSLGSFFSVLAIKILTCSRLFAISCEPLQLDNETYYFLVLFMFDAGNGMK